MLSPLGPEIVAQARRGLTAFAKATAVSQSFSDGGSPRPTSNASRSVFSRAEGPAAGQLRMNARISSRFCSIRSWLVASRFRRSSGSVFDARTLKCQLWNSTETPSRL